MNNQLALSTPPGRATLDFAEEYLDHVKNPNRPPPGLTWAEILAEEPFTGQHWEGVYGLPPGSVVNEDDNGDVDSDDSVLSLSLLDDDYDDMAPLSYDTDTMSEERSSVSTPPSQESGLDTYMKQWAKEIDAHSHRHEVEQLQSRQYWRNEWRIDASTTRPFDIGDASTFGKREICRVGGHADSYSRSRIQKTWGPRQPLSKCAYQQGRTANCMLTGHSYAI